MSLSFAPEVFCLWGVVWFGGSRMCWVANAFSFSSASPLNGEAAELWDKDREEFKSKVVARHRDVEDE